MRRMTWVWKRGKAVWEDWRGLPSLPEIHLDREPPWPAHWYWRRKQARAECRSKAEPLRVRAMGWFMLGLGIGGTGLALRDAGGPNSLVAIGVAKCCLLHYLARFSQNIPRRLSHNISPLQDSIDGSFPFGVVRYPNGLLSARSGLSLCRHFSS
jgi:hypothetical protein